VSRPFIWLALAFAAAPAFAFLVYRLAKGLGYLDPPMNRQHELRRTISLAVYAFLLFLPVLIYGFEKGWPRAWILFGILDGGALLFFAGSGVWAARELWRIRHPVLEPTSLPLASPASAVEPPAPPATHDDALASAPLTTTDLDAGETDDESAGPPLAGR
jgi:hypothetical protein